MFSAKNKKSASPESTFWKDKVADSVCQDVFLAAGMLVMSKSRAWKETIRGDLEISDAWTGSQSL